jgi:hypothetical protein
MKKANEWLPAIESADYSSFDSVDGKRNVIDNKTILLKTYLNY